MVWLDVHKIRQIPQFQGIWLGTVVCKKSGGLFCKNRFQTVKPARKLRIIVKRAPAISETD
ncbi:MAG: hypothetical protein ACRC3B_10030, partial [Bacteroidia bacterium]